MLIGPDAYEAASNQARFFVVVSYIARPSEKTKTLAAQVEGQQPGRDEPLTGEDWSTTIGHEYDPNHYSGSYGLVPKNTSAALRVKFSVAAISRLVVASKYARPDVV